MYPLEQEHEYQADTDESPVADERAEDIVGLHFLHRG